MNDHDVASHGDDMSLKVTSDSPLPVNTAAERHACVVPDERERNVGPLQAASSNDRQPLLVLGSPQRCRAALCQHGDLGAAVVAVAADGRLLVLCVGGAQEPLQHPPAPLALNLRLYLKDRIGTVGKQDECVFVCRRANEGLNGMKGQQTQQTVASCLLTSPFKKQ